MHAPSLFGRWWLLEECLLFIYISLAHALGCHTYFGMPSHLQLTIAVEGDYADNYLQRPQQQQR